MKQKLALVVSVLILAALVVYSNPEKIVVALSNANLLLLLLSFVLFTSAIILHPLKWFVLIRKNFRSVFFAQLSGVALSNLTPGKIAEPTKCLFIKARVGTPVSKILPSIIWERILDVFVMLVLALIGFQFIPKQSRIYDVGIMVSSAFAILIFLLIILLHAKRFSKALLRIVTRLPIFKLITLEFLNSFYKTKLPKTRILQSLAITFSFWIISGVVFFLTLLSFNIFVAPSVAIGIFAISVLVGVASSLPGGIGSTEVVLTILLNILGVEVASAASAVLIFRAITFWYSTLLGLGYFFHAKDFQKSFLMLKR